MHILQSLHTARIYFMCILYRRGKLFHRHASFTVTAHSEEGQLDFTVAILFLAWTQNVEDVDVNEEEVEVR